MFGKYRRRELGHTMSIKYPQAYIEYLVHFHGTRDLFECHEVLEEYWKEHPEDPLAKVWVGLIQVAVSLYHHRRGNVPGAIKMMKSAVQILESRMESLTQLGLDSTLLLKQLTERIEAMQAQKAYVDLNLPIVDAELNQVCIEACSLAKTEWLTQSELNNLDLIHRHTLRDRSEVIAERRKEWERRRKSDN
jgi:predicted metal-dependent hydrolase